jgi:rod shape-determining protein MreC
MLSQINNLSRDNRDLQRQKSDLEAEIVRIKEENKFCQQVGLESKLSEGRKAAVARIIGRTPQNFNQILIVDKGSSDGIKLKAAVLSNGYLVGQVKTVSEKSSEIVLLTNHNNMTPAMLDKSREFGLVQGSLEGLVLTDIPAATKVENGEKVLSSGLGGEIPKGLLIGEVAQSGEAKGLFQTLRVESPFVLSRTEVVSILLDE